MVLRCDGVANVVINLEFALGLLYKLEKRTVVMPLNPADLFTRGGVFISGDPGIYVLLLYLM